MTTRVRIWAIQSFQKCLVRSRQLSQLHRRRQCQRSLAADCAAVVELLDRRVFLSATAIAAPYHVVPSLEVEYPLNSAGPTGNSLNLLQKAYGFNQISLPNGINGTGQTIAIVDAYHNPTIQNDLRAFDAAFGIPDPPSLTVMSQTGSTTSLPPTDPSPDRQNNWELEESLDVEWAHALAPGARIVLVEANSPSLSDLMAAVTTAANLPGVSVVSMSWGGGEFSSEASYDNLFKTPAGHQGVTFVASTGDNGRPGGYPAYSPNVLAVGGTTLSINASGTYVTETAWSGSGGGISTYEAQPAYQNGTVTQTTTKRAIPDVSFDADPNSGVAVYASFSNGTAKPWSQIGGTSLSAPAWGALISIVNHARSLNGLGSLDGATQLLPMLYQLNRTNPSAFHDITTGSNGYFAGPKYDLVTGLGSPVVSAIVSGLSGTSSGASKLAFQQVPSSGTAGQTLGSSVTVAVQNSQGQILSNDNSTVTLSISSGPGSFASGSTVTVAAVHGIATFSNLRFNTAGNYTLSASDGSLTGAVSSSLTINAAPASKLAFLQTISGGTVGRAISPAVTVAVEDLFGNVVTGNSSVVTIGIGTGPGGLTTSSTLSLNAVRGIATFNNLVLSAAGTYTLKATDGNLSQAVSASFNVIPLITAPQITSLTATSTTTAQLTWTSVSSAQGYRILMITATQSSVLLSVSSSTTSTQIAGLTAGATYTFKVEAYSGSAIADSSGVSLTMPSPLSAPVVSGKVISTTSVQLTWTAISGADGYRIFWSNGVRRSLLGTVNPRVTSVQVIGLTPGSNQFLVEAYKGSIIADSNWVVINTITGQIRPLASQGLQAAVLPEWLRKLYRGFFS
jgi:hypothetical protein